jgi:YD repeat-containing protein
MTSQTATKSSTTLMNLTYSYQASAGQNGAGTTAGNAGQLMSITGTINGTTESASYTYDNVGRLVTSNQTTNSASAQRRFQYDRWGNRTAVWDAVTGGNQIQSVSLEQSGGVPMTSVESSDPDCDLDYVPNTGREARIDTALCNCIAFGSKNSALVFKKYEQAES